MQVQKKAQYKLLYQCVEVYLRESDGTNDHLESDYIYTV